MVRSRILKTQENIDEIYYGLQYDLQYLPYRDNYINYVLGNFLDIQHIQPQQRSYSVGIGDICVESPNGLGGGTSNKAFNIVFDLGKLMRVVLDKGSDFIGASPIGLVITAIKLCAQIHALRYIPIDERHAITIVALWELKNSHNSFVSGGNILSRVNKKFRQVNRNPLTVDELNTILGNLDDLRCIQMHSNGTILLKEKINDGSRQLRRLY